MAQVIEPGMFVVFGTAGEWTAVNGVKMLVPLTETAEVVEAETPKPSGFQGLVKIRRRDADGDEFEEWIRAEQVMVVMRDGQSPEWIRKKDQP